MRSIRVSIDRGGTFTDVYAEMGTSDSDVQVKVIKLLSEDPANYPDAPRYVHAPLPFLRELIALIPGKFKIVEKEFDVSWKNLRASRILGINPWTRPDWNTSAWAPPSRRTRCSNETVNAQL